MRYQWTQSDSIIQEMRFTPEKSGGVKEAIVILRPQEGILEEPIDSQLVDQGFSVTYDVIDGESALRVSGFRTKRDLLGFAEKAGMVAGEAETSKIKVEQKSLWKQIKENSLVLSAGFYMLGNAATALSGWLRRDMDELRTGLSFSVGDSFMLLFGKQNAKEKNEHVMQGFGKFLQQHGYFPEAGSSFAVSAVKEGHSSWKGIKKTMSKMVIPVKSVSEIYAGYSFAKAGFNQNNPYKKVAGAALMSGFGLGLTIPEKSKSQIRDALGVDTPEEAQKAIKKLPLLTRIKYAIQRQPLILSGGFAAINNLAAIASAVDERDNIIKTRVKDASGKVTKEGINRQLTEVNAKLYGGTYKPSLFQDEVKVSAAEAITNKVTESYQKLARLDTRANLIGVPGSSDAHFELMKLETQKSELENFIAANGGMKSKSEHTLKAIESLRKTEDQIIDISAPRNSEKGETLGQLHHEKINNSKLLDDQEKLLDRKKALEEGRSINLPFGKKLHFDQQNFWIFNMLQGIFFLAANSLYAMSSKSGGSGGNELADRFVSAVASEVLLTSDPTQRAEIISLASQYGGNLEEMDYTAGEVRTLLEKKLKQLESHSLVARPEEIAQLENTPEVEVAQEAEVAPAEHQTDNAVAPEAAAEPEATAQEEKAPEKKFADTIESKERKEIAPRDLLSRAEEEVSAPSGVTLH